MDCLRFERKSASIHDNSRRPGGFHFGRLDQERPCRKAPGHLLAGTGLRHGWGPTAGCESTEGPPGPRPDAGRNDGESGAE